MHKVTLGSFLTLPLALMIACGSALAQFKAQTGTQLKDGLGSGLGSQSIPSKPPAAELPAADEKQPTTDSVVQDIANCVLAGLPADWTLAQVEVKEIGRDDKRREFEAIYTYMDGGGKGAPFTPCDPREPAINVYRLNAALDPAKRNWMKATLVLSKEGKFELQYDYAISAEKDAPAAAPDAKKDAKKDAKRDTKKK